MYEYPITRVTRRVSHVEQELIILPVTRRVSHVEQELLILPGFQQRLVLVTHKFDVQWFVDRCLSFCPFSFQPLHFLSFFDLRLLITSLVSSLFFILYTHETFVSIRYVISVVLTTGWMIFSGTNNPQADDRNKNVYI